VSVLVAELAAHYKQHAHRQHIGDETMRCSRADLPVGMFSNQHVRPTGTLTNGGGGEKWENIGQQHGILWPGDQWGAV